MRLSGLLVRQEESLPGVVGTARVQRRSGDFSRRMKAGDIAVVDHLDLDRPSAEALVEAEVSCVVNAAQSISGRFPNLGPETLLSAGITLVDGVGASVLCEIKDGVKLRVHQGIIFIGDREIGRGYEQDADSVADYLIEAKAGMSAQLEAFSANTIEFLRKERMLILDGIGVPEMTTLISGRPFLVLAPGNGHLDDFKRLKKYIKEYRPVLVGVETGADTLCKAGYKPDIIVGDPERIRTDTLKSGAEMVIPAHLDGYAPGLERIQDLGIGAVTFPASGNPEDLALLIADNHGASLVITVGFQATLYEFLDRGRSGSNPSTFLTRLRLGTKLVDGAAVAALQHSRMSSGGIFALVLAVLIVALGTFVVSGLAVPYLDSFADVGNSVLRELQGLFR